jgi:hypothetical protein
VGGEWVAAKNYQGYNVQAGVSVSPIQVMVMPEMHSNIETTEITMLKDSRQSNSNSSTGFTTASLAELNSSAYSVGSSQYQVAVDTAYNSVASTLGAGQVVGWSSSQGYHTVSISSSSWPDWWY